MPAFVQWIIDNKAVLLAALLAVSEALSLCPWFKSNGIIQWLINVLKGSSGPASVTPIK